MQQRILFKKGHYVDRTVTPVKKVMHLFNRKNIIDQIEMDLLKEELKESY